MCQGCDFEFDEENDFFRWEVNQYELAGINLNVLVGFRKRNNFKK